MYLIFFSLSSFVLSKTNKQTVLCFCVCPAGYSKTSHPLAELQPATRQPAAAPLSAAGRAAGPRPARRPSAHSEQRAPRRPAASPPGWSRSAGPGSAGSLMHKFTDEEEEVL